MKYIKLPANYEYVESYIPPRCRKSRERIVHGDCEVEVPSITANEAPIAFRHRACWFPQTVTYRYWNNRLYRRVPYHECLANAKGWYPMKEFKASFKRSYIPCYEQKMSKEECLEALRDWADSYLIINGDQVWRTCGEPRYVIATFGLGGNHASTALMIDNEYNPNIAAKYYFNALDRDAAVREAVRVALARGDTDSVSSIKRAWKITVLIPEAAQCNPAMEAGPGDPFLNKLEVITEVAKDPVTSACLIMGAVAEEIE